MRAGLLLLALAAPAKAQEALPPLPEILAGVAGQEVLIEGHIGTGLDLMDDEALAFRLPDGTVFPVVFDAGRDARRRLEGCRFQMFGGTPCRMSGKAELEWDGSRLRLIVFALDVIEPPSDPP